MSGNLSDIAAMGGYPRFAFVSIGIPDYIEKEYLLSIYKGMDDTAAASKTFIAGGDTSSSSELVINIAIYGEVIKDSLVLRNGALSEDRIFVTGTIGDSAAGLEILKSNENPAAFPQLINKHLQPENRTGIVDDIIDLFNPASMIDISDGLLSDLGHICKSSDKGFEIYPDRLPLSPELIDYSKLKSIEPSEFAFSSGEEYELLFTSSIKEDSIIPDTIKGIKVTEIGKIIKKGYYFISDGEKKNVEITGFDHFK